MPKIRRAKAAAPAATAVARRPMRFVTDEHQSGWSVAISGDQQGTHVHGRWHVTNLSDQNVTILKARIEGHEAAFSRVFTRAPDHSVFGSKNPILANRTSDIIADFTFFPGIGADRNPLITDVIFADDYAEEHRVQSVRFLRIGP
jgi:hypothetical protein